MTKRNRLSRTILAFILVLCLGTGCVGCQTSDKIAKSRNERYIRNYVEAMLKNIYLGDDTKYLSIKLGSKEDAQKNYEIFIDNECAAFFEGFEEISEEQLSTWRETLKQVFKLVKFEVLSAGEREDGKYSVQLQYEQLLFFENVLPRYEEMIRAKAPEWMENTKTDAEYSKVMLEAYNKIYQEEIASPHYAAAAKAEIVVDINEDGLLYMTESTFETIETLLIDSEFGAKYVEESLNNRQNGVTLGQYKGIEAVRHKATVEDKDIDREFHLCFSEHTIPSDHDTIEKWDFVTTDIVFFEMDKESEAKSDSDIIFLVGAENFNEEFDDFLIGKKAGENCEVTISYAEDYEITEFAGKSITFRVTIKEIRIIPELTDELVRAITGSNNSVELRAAITAGLEQEAEDNTEIQFQNDIMEAIIANCVFDQSVITEIQMYQKTMYESYEESIKGMGMTFEEYANSILGITGEEFKNYIYATAEFNVKQDRVLCAIAEAEKMEVSQGEFDSYVQALMAEHNYNSYEAAVLDYGEDNIIYMILTEKAFEFVLGNAIVK